MHSEIEEASTQQIHHYEISNQRSRPKESDQITCPLLVNNYCELEFSTNDISKSEINPRTCPSILGNRSV